MIKLQFSTDDEPHSVLICAFEHGDFSHVDVVLDDGRLLGARVDALGAPAAGVQIRAADYKEFSAKKIVTLGANEGQTAKFLDFLHQQIGKPYDLKGIIGFVIGRDWRSPNSWFCSELVGAALEDAGVFKFDLSVKENKLTPADLLLAISVIANVWP